MEQQRKEQKQTGITTNNGANSRNIQTHATPIQTESGTTSNTVFFFFFLSLLRNKSWFLLFLCMPDSSSNFRREEEGAEGGEGV